MRILVYAAHPAQYHFFKYIIKGLQDNGHNILLLIKTKDVLEKLANQDGFPYINIQPKVRKNNTLSILLASFIRTWKIFKIVKLHKIDMLIGTDSSIAQVGYLTRKYAITTLEDDYDVIKKLANLTYPYTQTILVPDVCKVEKWEFKKVGYNGYMKLAYLHPNRFTPNEDLKNISIQSDKYCLIRLAQLTAHHDAGIRGLDVDLVKKLIKKIENKGYQVFISTEGEIAPELSVYQLKVNYNQIHHVLAFASLLISDSQSMSVEAAMLGVPSIRFSDFAGRISVLEELEKKYQLTFGIAVANVELLLNTIDQLCAIKDIKEVFNERRMMMLKDKIDVTAFFTWFIENYPESVKVMKENPYYQYKFK
ncbi:MAG: hypothetical protein BGO29_14590 [Bacteroidales bacterium 36-12]|nr:MAG: hypothetical protein BGO29_14590 [Bacteroidales bacterium 36-12]